MDIKVRVQEYEIFQANILVFDDTFQLLYSTKISWNKENSHHKIPIIDIWSKRILFISSTSTIRFKLLKNIYTVYTVFELFYSSYKIF